MPQDQSKSLLTVDLEIRVNARVLTLRLGNLLRWIVPLVISVVKLVPYLRPCEGRRSPSYSNRLSILSSLST